MDRPLGCVAIVDGYSTGSFYMPLLQERGIPIVHVRSTPNTLKAHITDIANDSLKKNASYYTALIDGAQPVEKIAVDTDRDNFMGGAEAVEYGLIDAVLNQRVPLS